MIPLLLMLADGPVTSPVDAERAFAADAVTIGQWTAFIKWSTDDAVMFAPQPINAHAFLKDRKDPSRVIDWWPTASWMSCDGDLAVNTGGWKRPDGTGGYFSTVWKRLADGSWKWIVDGGDELKLARSRPVNVKSVRASCSGKKQLANEMSDDSEGARVSGDGTLTSRYTVAADGSRRFTVRTWDGRTFKKVIDDEIAAPK